MEQSDDDTWYLYVQYFLLQQIFKKIKNPKK